MKELESFFTRLPKGLKQEFVKKADEEGYKVQSLVAKLMKEWIDGEDLKKVMYEESMHTRKMFKQKVIPYKQYLAERFNDWSGYENE